ncbi:serine hydrolase domain-containing protein [Kribbella sp. CA-293567]|uniref:serine hydrolase domain-containing protein n=1 Tax=Kribbella sp. CA-293567 TaxID=3002436 RepID=UPI0022DE3F9C|nr:serine hydrolase domain-containing protein [Kribbella sp. CA-293567]WBQ06711.1 serine hydrolase [Kribbella sp. CA-293567]
MLTSFVDDGVLAGAVLLVSRDGQTHVEVAGKVAFDGPPMERDSLFRVASLTKPIVAAATMMLVDSGRLTLDSPVHDLLPELASQPVLRRPDGPLDDVVPAVRAVTVRDLLTFRLGLGESDNAALRAREEELELHTFGPPKPRSPLEPDEWIRRFATLPLQYQPGERWQYGTSSDLLGVLIARASGQPLGEFLDERIFTPLGMKDTGFTASDPARLTTAYVGEEVFDTAAESQWLTPPTFPTGSGGLVSTADDFNAFAQMLLSGGGGILSAESARELTTDQLTAEQRAAASATGFIEEGAGWGFGLSVGGGRYGWAGGLGALWSTAPDQQTVVLLLTTRAIWTWPPELFAAFEGAFSSPAS